MKFIVFGLSLLFSLNSLAQQIYTFDCASDYGYMVVRVEAEKFNSELRQIPAEFEVHSDAGSESIANALITTRSIDPSTESFKMFISLGRSGSANMSGNIRTQKGAFSVKTARTRISSSDAECRFFDGSGMSH